MQASTYPPATHYNQYAAAPPHPNPPQRVPVHSPPTGQPLEQQLIYPVQHHNDPHHQQQQHVQRVEHGAQSQRSYTSPQNRISEIPSSSEERYVNLKDGGNQLDQINRVGGYETRNPLPRTIPGASSNLPPSVQYGGHPHDGQTHSPYHSRVPEGSSNSPNMVYTPSSQAGPMIRNMGQQGVSAPPQAPVARARHDPHAAQAYFAQSNQATVSPQVNQFEDRSQYGAQGGQNMDPVRMGQAVPNQGYPQPYEDPGANQRGFEYETRRGSQGAADRGAYGGQLPQDQFGGGEVGVARIDPPPPAAQPRPIPTPRANVPHLQPPQQDQPQTAQPGQNKTPPNPSGPQENILMQNIDQEIHQVVEEVRQGDQGNAMSLIGAPLDPNLVCPLCLKQFHIGEIQKYKKHVDNCEGT